MTKKQRCLLVAILLLAAVTRLYKLTACPGAFGQDECLMGYDAYCLIHTLRDQHGEFLPLLPRMCNDYISGVQTYVTIPFVAILGLTEQAVRLACTLPNIVAVYLMFLLARQLFKRVDLALWASFVMAIAPWHLYFSRWAVQANFVPFFLLLFLVVFFKAMDSPAAVRGYVWAALAGVAFVLLAQVYPSQMFFAPLLGAFLGLVYLRRRFRRLLVMGIVTVLGMLPFAIARMSRPAAMARFYKETIIFYHNFPALFWERCVHYLSPSFIFEPVHTGYWQQFPGTAYLPTFFAPFFALGLFGLLLLVAVPAIRQESLGEWLSPSAYAKLRALDVRPLQGSAFLVLVWVALAPVPAALFQKMNETTRVLQLFPAVGLVIAVGLTIVVWVVRQIRSRWCRYGLVLAFAAVITLHLSTTYDTIRRNNNYFKETMQYGVREVLEYLRSQPKVAEVFFPPLHQGYIYYLFYNRIDPRTLDKSEVFPPPPPNWRQWNYMAVPRVGNYHFNVQIDEAWVKSHAVLRHQVKDQRRIWFHLYEDDSHRWYVVRDKWVAKDLIWNDL